MKLKELRRRMKSPPSFIWTIGLIILFTGILIVGCESFNLKLSSIQKVHEFKVSTNLAPEKSRVSIDSSQSCLYFFDKGKQRIVEYYLNADSLNSIMVGKDKIESSGAYNCEYLENDFTYFQGVHKKANGDYILKEYGEEGLILINQKSKSFRRIDLPLGPNEWMNFDQTSGFISHGDTIIVQVNRRDLSASNFLKKFVLGQDTIALLDQFLRFPNNYREHPYGGNDYSISFCELRGKLIAGFPKTDSIYTDIATQTQSGVKLEFSPAPDLSPYDTNYVGVVAARRHYFKYDLYQDMVVNNQTNKVYRLLLGTMNDSIFDTGSTDNRPFSVIELDDKLAFVRSKDFSGGEYDFLSLVPYKEGFILRANNKGDSLLEFHYFN